jgi:hypothetical protein
MSTKSSEAIITEQGTTTAHLMYSEIIITTLIIITLIQIINMNMRVKRRVRVTPLEEDDLSHRRIKVGFISDFVVSLHSVAKDRLGIIKYLYNDPEFDVKIMTRKAESDMFFNSYVFADMNTSDLIVKMDSDNLVENRQHSP